MMSSIWCSLTSIGIPIIKMTCVSQSHDCLIIIMEISKPEKKPSLYWKGSLMGYTVASSNNTVKHNVRLHTKDWHHHSSMGSLWIDNRYPIAHLNWWAMGHIKLILQRKMTTMLHCTIHFHLRRIRQNQLPSRQPNLQVIHGPPQLGLWGTQTAAQTHPWAAGLSVYDTEWDNPSCDWLL